jgi:hypothetical protein
MWWIVFGSSTRYEDIGTVADRCLHCHQIGPCKVTYRFDEPHLYFVTVSSKLTEIICTCGSCGGQFPAIRAYRGFVPSAEALAMPLETLIEQTNPAIVEWLEWAQRRQVFADDTAFATIADCAEQLGDGALGGKLMEGLRHWDRLDEPQRAALANLARDLGRVLQFARSLAPQVPGSTGCLAGALACVVVWASFVELRAAGQAFLGSATGFVGLLAGPLLGMAVLHLRRRRNLRLWTEEVLIPGSAKAGIDLAQLVTVLQQLPATGVPETDKLRPLREQSEAIVDLLVASGKVERQNREFEQP